MTANRSISSTLAARGAPCRCVGATTPQDDKQNARCHGNSAARFSGRCAVHKTHKDFAALLPDALRQFAALYPRTQIELRIEVFRDVRVKFASNDRAKGTAEEYKDASLSASCSFGTYSVDPASSEVTMKIDRSTFPNYDDTT